MNDFIKALDDMPLWAKILLALPVVDIVWNIYRLCKSIRNNYTLGIVIAVLLLIFSTIVWLVDIITIAIQGKILWFDDALTDNKKDGE